MMVFNLCRRPLLLNVFASALIVGFISVLAEQINKQIVKDSTADDTTTDDHYRDEQLHMTEPHGVRETDRVIDSLWNTMSTSDVHSKTNDYMDTVLMFKQLPYLEPDNIHVFDTKSPLLEQSYSSDANNHDVCLEDIPGNFHIADKFLCLPCTCNAISNSQVAVKCFTKSTVQEINAVLPPETWSLFITRSAMTLFNASDFLKYPCLHSLTISSSRHLLKVVTSADTQQMTMLKKLELLRSNIRTIDDRSFQNMPNLLNLSLSDNSIKEIKNFTFEGLYKLQVLNLRHNSIKLIESGSFKHFSDLRVLDLSRNIGQGYNKPFQLNVFSNLVSLTQFYIHGNDKTGEGYPNHILGKMSNLTELAIDGLKDNIILGPEIKYLKQLVTLNVVCRKNWNDNSLQNITESFFVNVPYLQILRIKICPLQHMDSNAFKNIRNVTTLELYCTYPYSIFDAFDGLEGLQNSSLRSLSFIGLIAEKYDFVFLTKTHLKYVKYIELEEMDLSDNRLSYLGHDFFQALPRTLRKLVLHKNKLIEPYLLLDKLCFLEKLETLDLGTYIVPYSEKGITCSESAKNKGLDIDNAYDVLELVEDHDFENEYLVKTSDSEENCQALGTGSKKKAIGNSFFKNLIPDFYITDDINNAHITGQNQVPESDIGDSCYTPIPPKLHSLLAPRFLEMDVDALLSKLNKANNSKLTEIDFSYCNLPNLDDKTVLPLNIERANFNGNYMTHLPCSLFQPGNALTHLSLNNNLLGEEFALDDGFIFSELQNVTYLDISMNMIFKLSQNFFKGLVKLQILLMNKNKLEVLNANFSNMPLLWYMSLKKNAITWIRKHSRDGLDTLATHRHVYVDLSLNPLHCTCEGLDILIWIKASNVKFVSSEFQRCLHYDGTVEDVGKIDDRVNSLKRSCVGKAVIIVLCVASLVVICVLVGFGLMYRYRWKLRYIRSVALSRFVGFKPRETTSSIYKFDAYILYSETSRKFVLKECRQELEVKRGLKLCLDERDFMPGTYAVSAIVSAIQNSRKTVLIVTQDFYEEEYSEYAVKMAIMEEIYTNRSVLYLCVIQSIPDEQICKCPDLLMLMKKNQFIELPLEKQINKEVKKTFWDHLSQAICPTFNEDFHSSQESARTNSSR